MCWWEGPPPPPPHADLSEFADTTLRGWIPNTLAAGKALKVHVLQNPCSTFSASFLWHSRSLQEKDNKVWTPRYDLLVKQQPTDNHAGILLNDRVNVSLTLRIDVTQAYLSLLVCVLCCGVLLCRTGIWQWVRADEWWTSTESLQGSGCSFIFAWGVPHFSQEDVLVEPNEITLDIGFGFIDMARAEYKLSCLKRQWCKHHRWAAREIWEGHVCITVSHPCMKYLFECFLEKMSEQTSVSHLFLAMWNCTLFVPKHELSYIIFLLILFHKKNRICNKVNKKYFVTKYFRSYLLSPSWVHSYWLIDRK